MNQGPQRLYADCAVHPFDLSRSSRIGMVPHVWEDADLPRAPSLRSAADLWLWLLRRDFYYLEPGGDLQPNDYASWPLWLKWSALA
jgi:hypothetical protein